LRFTQASRIHESMRIGRPKASLVSKMESVDDAIQLHQLFFPKNRLLTRSELASMFAKEVGVYVDVVMDVLGEDSLWMALANESNKSASRNWSVMQAVQYAESVAAGAVKILDVAHMMDEIEARLFWRFILSDTIMTEVSFIRSLSKGKVQPDILKRHMSIKSSEELIRILFDDPESLDAGGRWYEEPSLALMPRHFLPYLATDGSDRVREYNGGVFQRIMDKGSTKMLHILNEIDGSRLVWRDRSGRLVPRGKAPILDWDIRGPVILEAIPHNDQINVYDAIFPRYPMLTLDERLSRFQDMLTNEPVTIHFPSEVEHWSSLSYFMDDDIVRFPNPAPYNPSEDGGYTLMRSLARKYFRVHSFRQTDEGLMVKVNIVDGIEDYIVVGTFMVKEQLSSELQFSIKRRTPLSPRKEWQVIDKECIVLEVVVPEIDRESLQILQPLPIAVHDDRGISDVVQLVDLLHGED